MGPKTTYCPMFTHHTWFRLPCLFLVIVAPMRALLFSARMRKNLLGVLHRALALGTLPENSATTSYSTSYSLGRNWLHVAKYRRPGAQSSRAFLVSPVDDPLVFMHSVGIILIMKMCKLDRSGKDFVETHFFLQAAYVKLLPGAL